MHSLGCSNCFFIVFQPSDVPERDLVKKKVSLTYMQSLVFASRLTGWNCTALPMKNRAVDVPWVLASSHPGAVLRFISILI